MHFPSRSVTASAPSSRPAPLATRRRMICRLNGVTRSDRVSTCAIDSGTPTWSRSIVGSGEMTERDDWSTRLPIRWLRNRPNLPLRPSVMDRSGNPLRAAEGRSPRMLEMTRVATSYWSRLNRSTASGGRWWRSQPCLRMWFRSSMQRLLISISLTVMSLWPRARLPSLA